MDTVTAEQIRAKLRDEGKGMGYEEDMRLIAQPAALSPGSDAHLAYLTLVYVIGGGREVGQLWRAAAETYAADPQLFDPQFLAWAKPADLLPRLRAHGLIRKKSEATVWQRIGQALVMRAGGSVQKLLGDNGYDAGKLMGMLARSKTVFPVLSGPQTAPRWLYGLATVGGQPIMGAGELPVPVSPAVGRVLASWGMEAEMVPADLFEVLEGIGRGL